MARRLPPPRASNSTMGRRQDCTPMDRGPSLGRGTRARIGHPYLNMALRATTRSRTRAHPWTNVATSPSPHHPQRVDITTTYCPFGFLCASRALGSYRPVPDGGQRRPVWPIHILCTQGPKLYNTNYESIVKRHSSTIRQLPQAGK